MLTFQIHPIRKVWYYITLLFIAAFLILPVIATGQTQHFRFKANTGENYAILIRTVTLNGIALAPGDEIGVFTPAGLCVGANVVSSASNIPLVAWQDDPQTPLVVDGYTDGDSMHFRFWHAGAHTELPAEANYLDGLGNGTFGFSAYAYVDLSATFNFTPKISLPDTITFDEDTAFEVFLDALVSDANDADSLLRWQFDCGANVTATIAGNRVLRLIPAPNWYGSETCTFIVTDPAGASDTAVVKIQVQSVNDLPLLQLPHAPLTIDEDDTTMVLILDALVTDVESPDSALTWTVTPGANISVRFDTLRRLIRLVPAPNFNGASSIDFSVKDPDGGVSAANGFPITVTPVPDPPAAAVLLYPIRGDTVRTLNPVLRWQPATDPDGDRLHYAAIFGTSPTLTTAQDTANTDTTFFKIPEGLKPGNRYYWRVTASDGLFPPVASGIDSFYTSEDAKPDTTVRVRHLAELPSQFVLEQNYPNPFSLAGDKTATRIRFVLPQPAVISVRVYNALGQLVRELFHGVQTAGSHQLIWDGRNDRGRHVSSGLYWLRLESDEFVATRKMLIVP